MKVSLANRIEGKTDRVHFEGMEEEIQGLSLNSVVPRYSPAVHTGACMDLERSNSNHRWSQHSLSYRALTLILEASCQPPLKEFAGVASGPPCATQY